MPFPMEENGIGCPICRQPVDKNLRYPRAVCPDCIKKAADPAGRPVIFFNESLSGGISGLYADDRSPYKGTDCYINGIHCRASEAHMGGIVIEPV
ncbi:MAG: hypothetical protein GYA12_15205 [Chloroflexi bacterium]|nr:hypothetical protein [Chloroflexota bacterium]BCY17156.1 hypothetical protein hrd7_10050 [Leptolinea sp. HRD-7]